MNIKKIAVFTSGGDAPGMNACIRSVVRCAIGNGIQVMGIMRGYEGMVQGEFVNLDARSVSNIIQRGGTILKTARSKSFMTAEGMQQAYHHLQKNGIEGIVAIGGDGTFKGAVEFNKLNKIPFIGIPGTIDNDLDGTDYTIGFDTALNTIIEALDKIRDTAASHDRLFFVEVMGRDSGCLALYSGIACGAEEILLPEQKTDMDALVNKLKDSVNRRKTSSIVIVAEGDDEGGAFKIAEAVKQKFEYDIRVTVLGHIQRGGNPTAKDRIIATRFGYEAVSALLSGNTNKMTGWNGKEVVLVDLDKAIKQHSPLDKKLLGYKDYLSI
jgi:6-phosphofructokinase 1